MTQAHGTHLAKDARRLRRCPPLDPLRTALRARVPSKSIASLAEATSLDPFALRAFMADRADLGRDARIRLRAYLDGLLPA